MVWILIADLNFQLQHLNFTAEFNILHSSFRIHIMGKCFYTFSFWIQLFDMTLFAVHFQLNKQIFIHCYFLLVLMPDEPALYIWQRYQFCIRYSLTPFRQSPHQISNPTSYIFHSTFQFLFTLSDHLLRQKKPLWGWETATYQPPPPAL